jgi:hypothetical protein
MGGKARAGGCVLSAPDRAEMMATTSTIGGDIVKVKPELKPLWDLLASAEA